MGGGKGTTRDYTEFFFILHTFELILLVNLIFFTEQHVKLPPKTRNRPRIEIEKKKVDSFSDVNNKTFL